jgi:hypothetical protein
MKIVWDEPEGTGWQDLDAGRPPPGLVVDIWMRIPSMPSTFGMADEFGVPDAWMEDGHWWHVYRQKPERLQDDYVSHWRPRQPGALPFGSGWGPAPATKLEAVSQ